MKKLLTFFIIQVIATVLDLAAAGVAIAGPGNIKYAYHLGDAFPGSAGVLPTDSPIPIPDPVEPTCCPEAVAGDTLRGPSRGTVGASPSRAQARLKSARRASRNMSMEADYLRSLTSGETSSAAAHGKRRSSCRSTPTGRTT